MENPDKRPQDTAVYRSCFMILIVVILLGITAVFAWLLSKALNIQFWCVLPLVLPAVLFVGINETVKWIRRSGPSFELASGFDD